MSRRLHTELLLQVSEDLAGERLLGQFDEEQNQDNLLKTVGPFDIQVGAGVTGQQVVFPGGVTTLRFLAIMKVDNENGVQVIFDNPANDPVLVKPPTGTSMEGQLVVTTSATALYLDNPDSAAAVNLSVMMGFANS